MNCWLSARSRIRDVDVYTFLTPKVVFRNSYSSEKLNLNSTRKLYKALLLELLAFWSLPYTNDDTESCTSQFSEKLNLNSTQA